MADPDLPVKIAYQGVPGAFSDAAAAGLLPNGTLAPQRTFRDVFAAGGPGTGASVGWGRDYVGCGQGSPGESRRVARASLRELDRHL